MAKKEDSLVHHFKVTNFDTNFHLNLTCQVEVILISSSSTISSTNKFQFA